MVISDLKLKAKSGKKYQETIYKGNLIRDFLKGISCWESCIGYPDSLDPPRLKVVSKTRQLMFFQNSSLENRQNILSLPLPVPTSLSLYSSIIRFII